MSTPEIQTGANAIIKVRNSIGDPSGATQTRWSDTELAEYLDRGQMQVTLDEPRIFKTVWTADLTASTREYSLPVSWVATQSVQFVKTAYTDIRELENVSYETYQTWLLKDEDNEGDPEQFYYWRKLGSTATDHVPPSIFLHPTPSTSASGNDYTLRIFGYKMPDDVAADTSKTMELEALFVEAAVMYACALAMFDDDDMARRDRFQAEYEKQVQKIIAVISRRDFSRVSRLMPKGGRGRLVGDGTIDGLIRWG